MTPTKWELIERKEVIHLGVLARDVQSGAMMKGDLIR